MRDLKRSLKKSNNSSPGPDQIHYEILRHLPIETLHILLDIINETWKSDTFPESWREALIISIPKPGKDNFNHLNYRPIVLTSCVCKTVERMVNERLVWYLERMDYGPNNNVVIVQIDPLLITEYALKLLSVMHLFKISI